MSAGWLLFARLILRPLKREPVRTALTVFAIALGVAVVVAIDLAGDAAAGSFHSSLESLTGKGDFMITGAGGLDERLLGRLVQLPYAFDFAPRIEDFASVNGKGEALPFLGLDLIGHAGEGEKAMRNFPAGNPIWAGRIWVGPRLGLRSGDRVRLLINDTMHELTVAGVLRPRKGEIGEANAIVADIERIRVVADSGDMAGADVLAVDKER